MRIGSLFSGAGALDLAALELFPSTSMAWHCEVDQGAARVLAHHWPAVPNLGDVSGIDWAAVEPVDIITGGFPCQDVSAAGHRAGLSDGTRSGLWSHMRAAVEVLRPRWVLVENVRGLLSARAIRTMESGPDAVGDSDSRPVLRALGAVLGDLADLGFDADWTCVRASDIGACHRRERVFVLAYPADTALVGLEGVDGGAVCGAPRGGRERVAAGSAGRAPVADAERPGSQGRIGAVPGADGWPCADRGGRPVAERGARNDALDPLLPTPSVADGTGGHLTRSGARQDELLLGGLARAAVAGDLLPTPRSSDGAKGGPNQRGSSGDLMLPSAVVRWGDYEPAIRRQEAWSRPAPRPTEPNSKGDQRLSPAFSEWMMAWPQGWATSPELGLSRTAQLTIIGNGVVPAQAVAAFSSLLTVSEAA